MVETDFKLILFKFWDLIFSHFDKVKKIPVVRTLNSDCSFFTVSPTFLAVTLRLHTEVFGDLRALKLFMCSLFGAH